MVTSVMEIWSLLFFPLFPNKDDLPEWDCQVTLYPVAVFYDAFNIWVHNIEW